jgi:tetratricopeptide (TPR) repeat protein
VDAPLPDPALAAAVAEARQKVVASTAAPPTGRYTELVAEGKRLFEAGRGRRAQALFEQALAERPDGVEALVGLGYAQLDRGKLRDSVALLERALERDGNDARAVFGLAEAYRQQGNRAAALASFKRYLKLRSSGGDADIARRLVQDLAAGR